MRMLYNLIALIAITNFLIISGLLGYLVSSGRLNAESLSKIVAILRGEDLRPETTTAPVQTTQPTTQRVKPAMLENIDIEYALLEREKRVIQDRMLRLKDAELKLLKDREAFLAEKDKFYKEMELIKKAREDEGFQKALSLYSNMPPKLVKEDFMKLDIDVVVRYLMNMPKMTASKILREFKSPEEQKRRQEILERIRAKENSVLTAKEG